MTRSFSPNNFALYFFILGFISLTPGIYAFAQDNEAVKTTAQQTQKSSLPIEIEADDALEWDREGKTYTAQGNAVATQGTTQLKAETLIADYREADDGSTQIWRLTAITGVILISEEGTAYGDRAVYKIDEAVAEMTGNDLRMENPDQIMTANQKFEYFTNANRFEASGDVVVDRGEDKLNADKIITFFKNDENGERVLDKLEAQGNVIITTPEEILKGRVGVYDPNTQIAELLGNVSIEREQNILTGSRATVDLETNISRLFGSPAAGERVKGVFFPNSDSNNTQNTADKNKTNIDPPPNN